eukprot:6145087-Prymnesium_polylepis.1
MWQQRGGGRNGRRTIGFLQGGTLENTPSLAPEIAAAQGTMQAPRASDYSTTDEARRDTVAKVASLLVPNVHGKWVTPMVRPHDL